jgi:flagellar protein FlaJ
MLRPSVDRELAALVGVRVEEARRTALLLVGAILGLGAAVAGFGVLSRQFILMVGGLAIALSSVLFLFYPAFEVKGRVRRIEGELLPAALFATIYASAERDMSEGLYAVEPGVAPHMAEFVKNVERMRVKKLIATPHEALGEAARMLEGSKLSGVLMAVSTARAVGLSQYIQARDILKSVLFELRSAYARLAENVKLLGEIILVFFGVLPLMMLIISSIFYSAGAAAQLLAYVFLMIPAMGVALAYLIDSAYPKTPESFLKKYRLYLVGAGIGAGVGVAVATALAAMPLHIKISAAGSGYASAVKGAYAVAAGVAAGALAAGVFAMPKYFLDARRRWGVISALPYFVRDLAESVKTGFAPAQAVVTLVQRKSYNKHFDGILKSMARRIAKGAAFREAAVEEAREVPWIAGVVLAATGEAERLGARHEVFADLADAVRDIVDILKAARSAMWGAVMFGLITVVIITVLLGGVAKSLIFQVADQATSLQAAAAQMPGGVQLITWPQVPEVLRYALIGAVLNAVVLGVLIGKMAEGNFYASSLYLTVSAAIAIVSLFISLFI